MIEIGKGWQLADNEVEFHAIRAQGAGGQNVNKVSSAVQLRFDIPASSLPETCKQRLLAAKDSRLSREGVLVIKAQRFRTQERNREDALLRLRHFILESTKVSKRRIPTRPGRAAVARRLDAKGKKARLKSLRARVKPER